MTKAAYLRKQNALYPPHLISIDLSSCPYVTPGMIAAFRPDRFIVQVFLPENGGQRITVCRTSVTPRGDWSADISWDDLQQCKNESGFADHWAVEIFPPIGDLVNVANLRHLWVMPEALPFAWRRSVDTGTADDYLSDELVYEVRKHPDGPQDVSALHGEK